jgi:hypothetical protein
VANAFTALDQDFAHRQVDRLTACHDALAVFARHAGEQMIADSNWSGWHAHSPGGSEIR